MLSPKAKRLQASLRYRKNSKFEGPCKAINFEQLIENQRDINFLDKLIADGD